jgi:cellulose synthase/poly-beta-1,6-N-acetylglucosamine synthase-like glycosyltransferase
LTIAWLLVAGTALFGLYCYVGYPLALRLLPSKWSGDRLARYAHDDEWPAISISVPAYNEEHQIADTLESLLALDYPADRRQILIVSDASTDRTDEIVRAYADRGVTLVRQPERRGKTAAEELAARHLTADIVVNTDASIRISRGALKALIAPFKDPRVGLASGRDVSVGASGEAETNQGEAGYVGYEMWIRDLETRAGGIVGASGCLYAIRAELHRVPLPAFLSRDFAAALHTFERGRAALSVPEATCLVPRTDTLAREYRRKVRTITRGMQTLLYKRALLDHLRHGRFAWVALIGLVGLIAAAPASAWARGLLLVALVPVLLGGVGWLLARRGPVPGVLAVPAYLVMGNVAAMAAATLAFRGDESPVWEPTRRSYTDQRPEPSGHDG